MGCIYLVTGKADRDDHPKGALKTIMPFSQWSAGRQNDAGSSLVARYAGLVHRFRREAMNWVRLDDHPNIVNAHGVHEIAGRPFLLLHYADSGDLAEWIKAGSLTVPMALDFASQFCVGMVHAVKVAGLVHRDIKPSNVLIHRNCEVKITDLGLARAFAEDDIPVGGAGSFDANDLSCLGGGTRPYMAPEQFFSLRDADTRSDVFSFGAMLFEMLTSQRLFAQFDALTASRDNIRLPRVHEVNSFLPESLTAIVARCVAYDRDKRYASFDLVARDIVRTGLVEQRTTVPARSLPSLIHPKERRDWNREVFSLLSLGQYEEAEQLAQQAIQDDPEYHGHWLNRGKALAEMGRFDEAYQCYARVTELAPEDVQGWFNVAYTMVSLGRPAEGLEAARHALAVDANCTEAWDATGCCEADLHGPRDALHYFRRAIDADGHNWRALANLGRCLSSLGQDDEALSMFEKSVAVNPDAARPWYQIACIFGEREQFPQALEAIDSCLRLDDRHAASWSMRGVILSQMGTAVSDLEEAADSFRRAMTLDPNDSLAATMFEQVETHLDTHDKHSAS